MALRCVFLFGLTWIVSSGIASADSGIPEQWRGTRLEALAQPDDPETRAGLRLGRLLFYDPILSGAARIACASCHQVRFGTGDGFPVSLGTWVDGQRSASHETAPRLIARNALDVLDRGQPHWRTMFWDARVRAHPDGIVTPLGIVDRRHLPDVLSAQAFFPPLSRDEMLGYPDDRARDGAYNALARHGDHDPLGVWGALLKRIANIPEYRSLLFQFSGSVSDVYAPARAIGLFQRFSFQSRRVPWDLWLDGKGQISDTAVTGASLFFGESGCSACHGGPLFTDQQFHTLPVPPAGPGKKPARPDDPGRFLVVPSEKNLGAFRTPTLRNLRWTRPFMHNGAASTVTAAILLHQEILEPVLPATLFRAPWTILPQSRSDRRTGVLPRKLTTEEISAITSFLETLSMPRDALMELQLLRPATVPSGLQSGGEVFDGLHIPR